MKTRLPIWRTFFAGVALTSIAILTGCSASNPSGDFSGASGEVALDTSWPTHSVDAGAMDMGAVEMMDSDSSAVSAEAGAEQAVIQTGYLSIRVDDPATSLEEASAITTSLGGRVDSRNINHSIDYPGPTSAYMTLRIPESNLDEAIDRLSELGTVRSDQRDARDVTMEKVDLQARVDSLSSSIERLEALVTDAGDLSDLIELETALADRQAQLDSLTAQLDHLNDQVSYSTVSVEFVSISSSSDPEPESFWSAFVAGLKSLVAAFSALVIGAGFLIPWIVVVGVIALVIILIVRGAKRRKHRG